MVTKFHNFSPVEQRLTYVVDENGCWLWTRAKDGWGYAEIWVDKKRYKTHRYMYEQKFGEIPAGLTLDHLCRVRHCINPDHLEAVTNRENILRGEGLSAQYAKQTHCKRGHEFNEENTRRRGNQRTCRACARWYYHEKRAAAKERLGK